MSGAHLVATEERRTAAGKLCLPAAVQMALEWMLAELESNRLEVGLVPCRRETNVGGCIRVAFSKNALWYRRFCAAYGSSRRRRNAAFDTRIKRAGTVAVLSRLIETGASRSVYAQHLLTLAKEAARKTA